MNAAPLPIPIEAVRSQIRRIAEFSLAHDPARLPIRAAFRDALAAVEREDDKLAQFSPVSRRSDRYGRR